MQSLIFFKLYNYWPRYVETTKESKCSYLHGRQKYQYWKAAFLACVDQAPPTAEYKLLQLKQCLAGEVLKAIEGLGHSVAAYKAAKERLERKFGGQRQQIAIYLEEIYNFRPVHPENFKDIEK